MKLHLPLSLRKSVLACLALTATLFCPVAMAANMHGDVSLITYSDFGQNMGRYKTDASANALLSYMREQDGGVVLTYTGGQEDILLPQSMINFTGVSDNGAFMSLGYSATVSVEHNGVFNGAFTSLYVGGSSCAVQYQGIEYRIDASETFIHSPYGGYDNVGNGGFDHKVTRMSKVITDVETATLYSGTSAEMHAYVPGQLVYHTGAGTMGVWSADGSHTALDGAYDYIIGGIDRADACYEAGHNGVGDVTLTNFSTVTHESITPEEPLPFAAQQGDSGSPIFVYNETTQQYEYIGAVAYGGGSTTQTWGAVDYVREVLEGYDKKVEVTSQLSVIHLGAVSSVGSVVSADRVGYDYDKAQSVSTTTHTGNVTDAAGNVLQSYVGVRDGVSTWKDLSGVIDSDTWYNYNADYLNASPYAAEGKELIYADLFMTENLVFEARAGAATTNIILDSSVDLGIGYAQFSLSSGQSNAEFRISSGGDGSHQFNHAGYVIDAGVSVHTTLTGSSDHVYEWRKVGAGDLHIEGSGNNKVLLNLGGTGTTYLSREGGYAAYNVLANTRATVVIDDVDQIARDFTFGHEGGTLDMNGNSMTWNNDNTDVSAKGFTIHALDENAIVANMKSGSTSRLTWTQGGEQTFVGSFRDNGSTSVFEFIYDGGTDSKLTLNSIFTDLRAEGSGMTVNSGTLALSGTHTVHGTGSAYGTNATRYSNNLDWHYADATSDVTVKDGATFELGSHARLTGDVTVEQGGVFVMREGVQHAQEYIEGGQRLENTADIAAFYGLKGNVSLEAGSAMKVEFSEETSAAGLYSGKISGEGSLSVDVKGVTLTLSGDNSGHTGEKTLESGGLIGTDKNSLGITSTHKWLVKQEGWIASEAESGEELLERIDTASAGTLALSADTSTRLNLAEYKNLYLGAAAGKTVQYGAVGTSEELEAVEGAWRLGGGGGLLQVNYKLTGETDLLLGASGKATGTVYLSNTSNDFSGEINFAGTGIMLKAADKALGNATLNLSYGNAFELPYSEAMRNIAQDAAGLLTLDAVSTADLDLSQHTNLALGAAADAVYSGKITLADGAAYRFGAADNATLTVMGALESDRDLMVDGQGFTGGKVVLGGNDSLAGNMTVQGHELGTSGTVALGFAQDVTLSGSVTLNQGGTLDVNGHEVTLTGALSGEGAVVDSTSQGLLVLQTSEDTTLSTQLRLANVAKTGDGMLHLTGSHDFGTLTVREGSLKIAESASAMGSTVRLESGTGLHTDGNVLSNISMADASTINCNGNRILGNVSVDANASAGYNPTSAHTAIDGNIYLGENAVLYLGTDDSAGGRLDLKGAAVGSAGSGLIRLHSGITQVNLQRGEDMHFSGTFEVTGNTLLSSSANADSKLREFDHLRISNSSTLRMEEVSWNTKWNIHQLSGDGKLQWNSWASHWSPSVLKLDGESGFSGDIVLKRTAQVSDRTHQAYMELASEKAAQNATIVLSGRSETAVASLAVNTSNACIAGLQNFDDVADADGVADSSVYSYVYAGSVPSGANVTTAPVSNRSAALTITGSGEYTYSGIVGNAADTAEQSLSLVMAGSGKQTLNGASVVLNNVTARQGTLDISPTSLTVLGDVAIAQGAALKLGDAFSLGAGQKLSVLPVDGSSAQATFQSELQLAGGTLCFDGNMLSEDKAALTLGGVSAAAGTNSLIVEISNMSDFATEGVDINTGQDTSKTVTYHLADGNWSALSDLEVTLRGDASSFMDTAIAKTAEGLDVTLKLKDDVLIWRTTSLSSAGGNTIGTYTFGAQFTQVGGKIALFTDVAEKKDVEVAYDVALQAMAVTTSQDYTFQSDSDGGVITTPILEHNGTGTATINSGVVVTDSVNVAKGRLVVKDGAEFFGSAPTVTLTDKGTLQVDSGAEVGALSMSEGAALSSSAEGVTVTAASLADFSGDTIGVDKLTLQVTDGVTLSEGARVLSGVTSINMENGGLLDDRSSYYAVNGTLNIGRAGVEAGGSVYVSGLALMGKNNGATLNVNADSSLVITGSARTSVEAATLAGQNYGDFQITTNDADSGGAAPVINVAGTLTSCARFSVAGGEATINVNEGGTVNLLRGAAVGGSKTSILFNVANGGRVNLTSYAWEDGNWNLTGDNQNNVTLNLADGAAVGGIGAAGEDIFLLQKFSVAGTATIDTDAGLRNADYTVTETDSGADVVLMRTVSSTTDTKNAVLRVAGHGTAHVAGALDLRGGVRVEQGAALAVSSGSIDTGSKTTSLSELARISSADGTNVALLGGTVRMGHEDTLVRLGSSTSSTVVLQNSLIELQQAVSLELSEVTLAQDSRIVGTTDSLARAAAPTVALNNVTVQVATLDEANITEVNQPMTLTTYRGGVEMTFSMESDSSLISLTSDQLQGLNLSSGSLTLEFSREQSQYIRSRSAEYLALSFDDSALSGDLLVDAALADVQGVSMGVIDSENGVIYFSLQSIPEPTTSTLSLLALSALVSRRRRK